MKGKRVAAYIAVSWNCPAMARQAEAVADEGEDGGSSNGTIARKAILGALEGCLAGDAESAYSCKPLLRLFQSSKRNEMIITGLTQKSQQTLVLDTIKAFQKGHARRFFSGIKSVIDTIISEEAYVPDLAVEDEESEFDGKNDKSVAPDSKSTEALAFLKVAAMCLRAYLDGITSKAKQKNHPKGMPVRMLSQAYDVALVLHNLLFSLQTCGAAAVQTQNAILGVCEAWWHANAVNRDDLIVQCLPLLVLQALDGEEFQKSQFKRIFQLKDAFLIIDFANPSSDSLRSLLLRVASNPLCLRMTEGKTFLSVLLQDPVLVPDLHLAIRAQIPEARKSVLLAYGEIYLKAWKSAGDADRCSRESIEHAAFQDLVHAAIHVASSAMAKSILSLLEPIHSARKSTEIAALLYRLYSPILWRSLAAANPRVRINAVAVLAQVFPLQEPSHNQMQVAVAKGTSALKAALQDTDPGVRVAASEATAQICTMFWEALPAEDIRTLLNRKSWRIIRDFFTCISD